MGLLDCSFRHWSFRRLACQSKQGRSEGTKIGSGSALNGASVSALLGLAASSLGIISFESPAYSIQLEFLFPLTIPLLLFRADLRRVFTSTGIFLLAFLIGTATAFPTQFNLLAPSGEALAMILTQVAIHLVAILGLGKLFRFDQKPLLIASNANIGGPTTASGMANAKGWSSLVAPAIIAYIFGIFLEFFIFFVLGVTACCVFLLFLRIIIPPCILRQEVLLLLITIMSIIRPV
ncbi:hypothetical protein D5086_031237 [Populus alba]|uniref:Uncharacterized protein n=1 Tax=Populus alba TaxID=43335 RepID=A0ACC4AQY2_POPAL